MVFVDINFLVQNTRKFALKNIIEEKSYVAIEIIIYKLYRKLKQVIQFCTPYNNNLHVKTSPYYTVKIITIKFDRHPHLSARKPAPKLINIRYSIDNNFSESCIPTHFVFTLHLASSSSFFISFTGKRAKKQETALVMSVKKN